MPMHFESYWRQLFQSRLSADELSYCVLPDLDFKACIGPSMVTGMTLNLHTQLWLKRRYLVQFVHA